MGGMFSGSPSTYPSTRHTNTLSTRLNHSCVLVRSNTVGLSLWQHVFKRSRRASRMEIETCVRRNLRLCQRFERGSRFLGERWLSINNGLSPGGWPCARPFKLPIEPHRQLYVQTYRSRSSADRISSGTVSVFQISNPISSAFSNIFETLTLGFARAPLTIRRFEFSDGYHL